MYLASRFGSVHPAEHNIVFEPLVRLDVPAVRRLYRICHQLELRDVNLPHRVKALWFCLCCRFVREPLRDIAHLMGTETCEELKHHDLHRCIQEETLVPEWLIFELWKSHVPLVNFRVEQDKCRSQEPKVSSSSTTNGVSPSNGSRKANMR